MPSTEQREIGKRCRAPVRPVTDVMPLPKAHPTPREAATLVPMVERAPQRRRDRPRAGPDLDDAAVLVVLHHFPASFARQPPRRLRGNARPILEDGLSALIR